MSMSKSMQNTVPENCLPKKMLSDKVVHVSVAVIMRDGKVLLSKRAKHVHQGGLWEFPGGKVEKGETIEHALKREINEELGIELEYSRPLIKLLHQYPDKSVLLETRLVTAFSGHEYSSENQTGLEGQAVQWVAIEDLLNYQFPDANKPIIDAIQLPEAYVISPDIENNSEQVQFLEQFALVAKAHSLIQVRVKSLESADIAPMVNDMCHMAIENRVSLLFNSSMLLKEELIQKTAGVHLTSQHLYNDEWISQFRHSYPEKIIAASCHNEKDIRRANQLKLDFIALSPVQHTASHPEQKPMGWSQFGELTDLATMPVYALGGMTVNEVKQAQEHGGQGIAAIRDLWNKTAQ